MQPVPADIPVPELLDPTGLSEDSDPGAEYDQAQSQRVIAALNRTSEYGRQLWDQLHTVRQFLLDNHPLGPDDRAWAGWVEMYTSVVANLSGLRGDSGFAASEARLFAQHWRGAPLGDPAAT